MFIPIRIDGDHAMIAPRGAIDGDTRHELYAAAASLPASITTVTWDLRRVDFMDSTALHLLNDQHEGMHAKGGTLTLSNPRTQPLQLLRLAAQLHPAGPWTSLLAGLAPVSAA
ncbi:MULTISPECIES: STAS domain-containing protein [unclassified Streptomyces]|uniref:STAS domain-containing protein n=1 Tax=unclassified Streptomyces TaxID=2593676 RepID=UPI000F031E2F|nr:STAS domain-containing protein [Streptomyces sp. Tu 4128]